MVDNLDLISETYSSEDLKNIEDKDNPLAQVNNLHSLAKSFWGNMDHITEITYKTGWTYCG